MLNKIKNNTTLFISLLTIASLVLFIVITVRVSDSGNRQKILITEVLTSNNGAFLDEDGSSPDYIELYNAGNADVNLLGWFLSDNSNRPMKWVIPNVILPPGEYVYFFASGKDKQQSDGVWHTNFKIAANGSEQIVLSTPDGVVHDSIRPPKTAPNISYGTGEDFSSYVYMTVLTPGKQNSQPFYDKLPDAYLHGDKLIITEYMSRNDAYCPDENGLFHDWVEIFNAGTEAVPLKGWHLSDNPDKPAKWRFDDDAVIAPGEYLLLYCSGELLPGHTTFKLSESDGFLTLSDLNGNVTDRITVVDTMGYASYGRKEDKEGFFEVPTPGAENHGEPLSSVTEIAWDKPTVIIMEYMTGNTIFVDDEGYCGDWAEIYNYGSFDVSLSGLYLSDKADNLNKWQFPDGLKLAPGERTIIWLTGKNRGNHASFSLGSDDDGIFISDRFGRIIESTAIMDLPSNVSAGRDERNFDNWLYFQIPTPNEPNTTPGFSELSEIELGININAETGEQEKPRAAHVKTDTDEIYASAGQKITLWTDEPDGKIYYTLDGKEPDSDSSLYTAPIVISGNTILRARVTADDKQPGTVLNRTYIIGEKHDIPVVTLISDPAGLFSSETGIYANGPGWVEDMPHYGANFWKNWEREVNFAFYENGALSAQADAGIRIDGQDSRKYPQKSFQINFRKKYGHSRLAYPLIPDINRNVYDALILRNSGQDIYETKLRDAVTHKSVIDVTNVIAMGARPVAVYLNGEYWGLYNLRENINEDYFKINHGIPEDEIDIIKSGKEVTAGSMDEYRKMVNTLKTMHDRGEINTAEAYAYIEANIDLDNWVDYWVIVTYFGNTATHNIKCYKQQGDEGKWRWILYDQDHSMRYAGYNSLANMLSSEGHGGFHGEFYITENVIERALMSNSTVRERFLERYAELLGTVLHPDRLISIIDNYARQIEPEIPRNQKRWGSPAVQAWEDSLEYARTFVRTRESRIKQILQSTFSLSGAEAERIFGK